MNTKSKSTLEKYNQILRVKDNIGKYIKSPFTDEQVKNLNNYQVSGKFHEFTCQNQGDDIHIKFEFEKKHKGENYDEYLKKEIARGINYPETPFNSTALIATKDGWVCPVCDYKQNWAYTFMIEKH